ncbi:unnamed protein product [Notodromas monacha]|uniref:Uncharacterized protein n=1 Tax=Notodromas monacha TaxID=399045 RepID=A0A7R9BKL0_9CRUS|nr:unnamed protein product [Notodromas monacha]CAG0915691.1 unnamed protein product [Notodromas monacha]
MLPWLRVMSVSAAALALVSVASRCSAAPSQPSPPDVSLSTALKVLPALDAKQVVVGLIEREDFEGTVADEAARARSATREGRMLRVPPEVTITSGALKVTGDLLPGRKGRIIEVGADGIPIVHGVREPDDETDNQVWRNADVVEGRLMPSSHKAAKALDLGKDENMPQSHPPADRIQPRILTGGDVHIIQAVPVEERKDEDQDDSLAPGDQTNKLSRDNDMSAASSNRRYQQSHQQAEPVYQGNKGLGVGSVEAVELDSSYGSNKNKKKKKNNNNKKFTQVRGGDDDDNEDLNDSQEFSPSDFYFGQQLQQPNQQQQQNQQQPVSDYFSNFQQQPQGGSFKGFETNYLHSDENKNNNNNYNKHQQQHHPQTQFNFGDPPPQAGQKLFNGGVVIGPADPSDFAIKNVQFDNSRFSVQVPVPVEQLSGINTHFVYEEPGASAAALGDDESFEELFAPEPALRQQRPHRRPPVPGRRQPPPPHVLHSHSRPGRPTPHRQVDGDDGPVSKMGKTVRQAMRRRYQQFQSFVNPVMGPLREAGQKISQNLGLAESFDGINERLATVVGAPGLPIVLGGALTLGALGLGAHALNNFEISVNRGAVPAATREKAAKAGETTVQKAIEAASAKFEDATGGTTPSTTTTTTTTAASTTAKTRRRKRNADEDPDFSSNMLEMVQSPEAVFYAKMGEDFATRKRNPCVGKFGCRVTSVVYPAIEKYHNQASKQTIPERAPRKDIQP